MRRLLLLLVIALLPLRAWAGDLMAIQVLGRHATNVEASAMPADCPMHTVGADHASAQTRDDLPASEGHHDPCDDCELCLPFVELTTLAIQAVPFVPHAPPSAGAWAFLSAPLALGFKPPIS